jgi:competence protein ComEA
MHKLHIDIRFWLAAAVLLALLAGYWLPRRTVPTSQSIAPANVAQTTAEGTVPPGLLAGNSDVSLPSSSPLSQATRVAVYVCGDVRHPGVYEFGPNRRVTDGIARAGGALPDADLEQLNLAEPLSDAMKIDVPKKGEHLALAAPEEAPASGGSHHRRARSHTGRSSHKLQPGQTLDVNTASESELTSLPGVGPGLARRIVEYRTANGPFQSVDDLQNVSGIGPSKFDRMASYIRL